ncbi:MAG: o-succinylbenzoate--CoA ligase [bacterium]
MREHRNIVKLISENCVFRHDDYDPLISQTIENVHRLNLKSGDRLAILGNNRSEYLIVLMALLKIGVIAVPISPRFPHREIRRLLHIINCEHLYTLPKGRCKKGALFNDFHTLPIFSKNVDAMKKRESTIIFTSGSSGEPKAVLHTLSNHYFSALGSNVNIQFRHVDRWLLSLPLYHVGGIAILMRALVGGGALVIPDDTVGLAENIKKFKITHISLVSTQLYRLLQNKKAIKSLMRLKVILIGGSPLSPALVKEAIACNMPIYTSYGSTEMCSQITTTGPGDKAPRLFTSGRLLDYRELKIAADGEILVKGETLFKGYVERDTTKQSLDSQGWFHTGDLGKLDNDGYLMVHGRKDTMFISGGENIHPEEIEKHLCRIDNVLEAVVVPISNDEFGERPVAFLKTKDGIWIHPDILKKHLEKNLARFKIPDYFFPFPLSIPQRSIKHNRRYFQELAHKKINHISP